MKTVRQNSNQKKRRGNRKPRTTIERMEHPPMIRSYQISHRQTLRFTATAATPAAGTVITFQNLLDAIFIADSAVTGTELFDIVKVRSVEIWAQSALGTPSTVGLFFTPSTVGDQQTISDTSLGIKPAYVKGSPSAKSLASFWNASAAVNAFTVDCPAGSIIDVALSFRTSASAPFAVAHAPVGATVGELYFRGLDGLATAATNFPPPVGIPTQ